GYRDTARQQRAGDYPAQNAIGVHGVMPPLFVMFVAASQGRLSQIVRLATPEHMGQLTYLAGAVSATW
ncbi:MAG TPA: hypothetical protein VN871_09935, partial [Mycobacterium sp.]|nr:hypothetical protein [Mycobacterium sp.]